MLLISVPAGAITGFIIGWRSFDPASDILNRPLFAIGAALLMAALFALGALIGSLRAWY